MMGLELGLGDTLSRRHAGEIVRANAWVVADDLAVGV
jgi:hypothetical protein